MKQKQSYTSPARTQMLANRFLDLHYELLGLHARLQRGYLRDLTACADDAIVQIVRELEAEQ